MPKPRKESFTIPDEGPYQEPLTESEALEEIERVRKFLDDPKWPSNYSKEDIDAAYQLAKEYGIVTRKKSNPEVIAALLKALEGGRYIGPLETQMIGWSNTKLLRDIFQNFYDGMAAYAGRPTLDGVKSEERTAQIDGREYREFVITSPAEYDHRYLIHHGGTTKFDDPEAAGEFGEGVKIAAFLLLQNRLTDNVELGSGHWKMIYYLDSLPEEDYPDKVQGLHVRAKFTREPFPGNYLKFAIPSSFWHWYEDDLPDEALEILKLDEDFSLMKDFFYSSTNEDFQNPTFESDFGGFELLPKGGKGNLYISGQRYEYGKHDGWSHQVEGMTIWTNRKALQKRRDRSYCEAGEFDENVLAPLVKEMTDEQARNVLEKLKDYWEDVPYEEAKKPALLLVKKIVKKLLFGMRATSSSPRIPEKFWGMCVARDAAGAYSSRLNGYEEVLKSAGFTICIPELNQLGMPLAREKIVGLVDTAENVELNAPEQERIKVLEEIWHLLDGRTIDPKLLEQAMGVFEAEEFILRLQEVAPKVSARKVLKLKGLEGEIGLHGFTAIGGSDIFINQSLLAGPFLEAAKTYLHELAHLLSEEINDFSSKFTRTDSNLTKILLSVTLANPGKVAALKDKWDAIEVSPSDKYASV
ncbi:MAG: hypothetical protein HY434_01580 [Candidatus Liptonbacteria bacterium]|nr:hypothetical protein [Candidatus Liptonbacteria bacterium]